MKYYLKENFRFLYADGQLYDEEGNAVYNYENTTIMFPRIDLYKNGTFKGYVKKRFSWFLGQYDIYRDNEYIDSIDQQFTFFKSELIMRKLGWIIKGDFLSWHYTIYDRNDNVIAMVDQELLRLTQRFYIEILDEKNEELIILLILAINQFDKDRSAAANSAASSASN